METRNPPQKRSKMKWLGGLGVLLLSVGSKLKSILSLLKFGKFGATFFSMLVSIGGYALLFPWQMALGLVMMLFIHEMGHVWAARIKGLPVSAPAFIPFLGALIIMKKQPPDAKTEAFVAFGGPLLGTLGALGCFGLALWTGHEPLYAISLIGFFINLFNLLPIHPLDGGRIVTAVSRWLWVLGLLGGIWLVYLLKSPLLFIILILFVIQLWSSFFGEKKEVRKIGDTIQVDTAHFTDYEWLLPAEKHERVLPHIQYCDVETREVYCAVVYPGLGVIGRLKGYSGEIHQVRLTHTDRKVEEGSSHLLLHLEVHYTPSPEEDSSLRKNQQYYKVPPWTRFFYGIAYFGLAAFLVYMMILAGEFTAEGLPANE